jgi:hypothetical protein
MLLQVICCRASIEDLAERDYSRLLDACEALAVAVGMPYVLAGANMARAEAHRQLVPGFRTAIRGVACTKTTIPAIAVPAPMSSTIGDDHDSRRDNRRRSLWNIAEQESGAVTRLHDGMVPRRGLEPPRLLTTGT